MDSARTTQPDVPKLRMLAAQGNLDAIRELMHQALSHKGTYAEVTRTSQTLRLTLKSDSVPDERVTAMLVCREVLQWPPFTAPWKTVVLEGQAFTSTEIGWIYEFSITPSEHLSTLRQAAAGSLWMTPVPIPAVPRSWVQPLDALGWRAIAAGIVLAMLVLASGQVSFLLSPLITLVHELGHTCLSWIFGYPAIPAFDFMNGGGVTMHSAERVTLILGFIYGAFGYLFYRYWYNYLTARILLAAIFSYTLCAFTPLQEILILFMGHGFELIFAGIFLYRAVSGSGCQYSIERPLYAMLSFYLIAYDLRFTFGLLFDSEAQDLYRQGKGGILDNDLVRIAGEYLKTDLSVVVVLLLTCTLITPAIAFALYRYRPWISKGLHRLFCVRYQH